MLGDIAELIVKLNGGWWKFREKLRRCTIKPLQKFYLYIYFIFLRSQGSYIGRATRFATEPFFPHFKGIFIAGGATIGKDCVIFHHVTIGANPLPFSRTTGQPTIGNNCYIGAGATIIGAIKIGNNCRIGANCTVNTDVPENSVVVSPQPKIIQKDKPMVNRFYSWSAKGPVYYDNGQWVLETDEAVIESLKGKL